MAYSVLLVEDDTSLAHWICEYLEHHSFSVTHFNCDEGVALYVKRQVPDLVILDLMLPNMSGFDICRELRQFYHKPILMLTASNDEDDEVRALELGATDFVSKPVRPKVLLARLSALLRRTELKPEDINTLEFGQLFLDNQDRTVQMAGKVIHVSATEFDLLWNLARHAGEIVSRDALLMQRRGLEYDGLDRSIDIAISRLRKKLGDDSTLPKKIKTIRAKGYMFAANAWLE